MRAIGNNIEKGIRIIHYTLSQWGTCMANLRQTLIPSLFIFGSALSLPASAQTPPFVPLNESETLRDLALPEAKVIMRIHVANVTSTDQPLMRWRPVRAQQLTRSKRKPIAQEKDDLNLPKATAASAVLFSISA